MNTEIVVKHGMKVYQLFLVLVVIIASYFFIGGYIKDVENECDNINEKIVAFEAKHADLEAKVIASDVVYNSKIMWRDNIPSNFPLVHVTYGYDDKGIVHYKMKELDLNELKDNAEKEAADSWWKFW